MQIVDTFHQETQSDASRESGSIFDDILFIRLTRWSECKRSTTLPGLESCARRIFRRFSLQSNPRVLLDFWYRGFAVSEGSARSLEYLLRCRGPLNRLQLLPVMEVLGVVGEGLLPGRASQTIEIRVDAAESGRIQGHRVLAVWWAWLDGDNSRKFLSIYTDSHADGNVHEVHFSAPLEEMEEFATEITETLRSFQWRDDAPPPVMPQEREMVLSA